MEFVQFARRWLVSVMRCFEEPLVEYQKTNDPYEAEADELGEEYGDAFDGRAGVCTLDGTLDEVRQQGGEGDTKHCGDPEHCDLGLQIFFVRVAPHQVFVGEEVWQRKDGRARDGRLRIVRVVFDEPVDDVPVEKCKPTEQLNGDLAKGHKHH